VDFAPASNIVAIEQKWDEDVQAEKDIAQEGAALASARAQDKQSTLQALSDAATQPGAGGGGEAIEVPVLCNATEFVGSTVGKPVGYWQKLHERHGTHPANFSARTMTDCFSKELTQLKQTVGKHTPPSGERYRTHQHIQLEFAAFTSDGQPQTSGGDDFSAYLFLESTLASDVELDLESGSPFFNSNERTMLEGFVQDLESGSYIVHFAVSIPGRFVLVLQHNFRCYQALHWGRKCFHKLPGDARPVDLNGPAVRAVLTRLNIEAQTHLGLWCGQTQHGIDQAASGMWADGAWRPHCCTLGIPSGHSDPIKFVGDSTMPRRQYQVGWEHRSVTLTDYLPRNTLTDYLAAQVGWNQYGRGWEGYCPADCRNTSESTATKATLQDWLTLYVPRFPSSTVLAMNPSGLHFLDQLPWEDAKAATVDLMCRVLAQFKGSGVVLILTSKVQREQHPVRNKLRTVGLLFAARFCH
jgi:hypothetical protein